MIDTKIVEPIEDGVDGNSCRTAYDVAFVAFFKGQLLNLPLHGNLPIALFVGAHNAFATDIQIRLSRKSKDKSIERKYLSIPSYRLAWNSRLI
jgi:hypothetical protein